MGETSVDTIMAYLGLGLWIPARARVIIGCPGGSTSRGGDEAPSVVGVVARSLAVDDVLELDTTGLVVDGVDGAASSTIGEGDCCGAMRPRVDHRGG